MKIVDLTHLLTDGMSVFPGDTPPSLQDSYDQEYDITHCTITTSNHTGTHMDGPLHMVKGARKLSEMSPDKFIANGHVIDVRGKEKIEADVLINQDIKAGDCVLFYTGKGEEFGKPDYFDNYPVLTEDLAKKLVTLKVKFIGTDACSPDGDPYSIHRILLGSEILILENLTNVSELLSAEKFEVIALPTKFDADSALVRVIARISE
jgi:kynurenine formamidase